LHELTKCKSSEEGL